MTNKLNSQKESTSSNENFTLKLNPKRAKVKLLSWIILLTLIVFVYYAFWFNVVSIANTSDYDLENVVLSKHYIRKSNPILWKGQVPANGKKYLFIPGGGSGDKVILEATWQGRDITKEQEYPAVGSGKFQFIVFGDGKIESQAKIRLFLW